MIIIRQLDVTAPNPMDAVKTSILNPTIVVVVVSLMTGNQQMEQGIYKVLSSDGDFLFMLKHV